MDYLFIDFETRGIENLRVVGAPKYAENCEVLCLSYALNDEAVNTIEFNVEEGGHTNQISAFSNSKEEAIASFLCEGSLPKPITIVAHSASFEYFILKLNKKFHYIDKDILKGYEEDIDSVKWICTMKMAKRLGLPASLRFLNNVIGSRDSNGELIFKKLEGNYKEISKKRNGSFLPVINLKEKMDILTSYCDMDVEVLRDCFYNLIGYDKQNTPSKEFLIDKIDDKINSYGIKIDSEKLDYLIRFYDNNNDRIIDKYAGIGINIASNPQCLRYLEELGVSSDNMRRETLENLLNTDIEFKAKEFIESRLKINHAASKKLKGMKTRINSDGIYRNTLNYCDTVTGRWASNGFQLQNIKRSNAEFTDVKYIYEEIVKKNKIDDNYQEYIANLLPTIMINRNERGRILKADYNAIELRLLLYYCGCEEPIELMEKGEDLYKDLASIIFNKAKNNITKEERFVGKTAMLSCGFGANIITLQNIIKGFNKDFGSYETSQVSYEAFHKRYPEVKYTWDYFDKILMRFIEEPENKKIDFGAHVKTDINLMVRGDSGTIALELPSGRKIYMRGVKHKLTESIYGDVKDEIVYSSKGKEHKLYGSVFINYLTQGTARDILGEAIINIDKAGYKIIGLVHDEVIVETEGYRSETKDIEEAMVDKLKETVYGNLQLKIEIFEDDYYSKL